jgi:hypothetical protein
MGLKVTFNNQVLFSADGGENVLAPFEESERTEVFHALTGALAVLCGVKPRYSPVATEAATGQHCAEISQYPRDHTDGVVVPLRARLVDRVEG